MLRSPWTTVIPAALLLALTAAACSKNTANPVAPSRSAATATSTPAPASTGATVSGTVMTSATSSLVQITGFTPLVSAGRVTVTVNDTPISVVSDDEGNFVLPNVPPGPLVLTITGSGFSVQVTVPGVGSNEQFTLTIRVAGNSATIDDHRRESLTSNEVEVEGVISSASNGTLVVGRLNTTVLVLPTTPVTGGTFADLQVGARIEARGTSTNGILNAASVEVERLSGAPGGPTGSGAPGGSAGNSGSAGSGGSGATGPSKEVKGAVAATPTGTCPAMTFQIGMQKVVTNASTRFEDTACTGIVAGAIVEVEGTTQIDGSILARKVSKEDGDDADEDDDDDRRRTSSGSTGTSGSSPQKSSQITLTGSMGTIGGTCPAISFTVNGTKVTTSTSTTFNTSCSRLGKGDSVGVVGTKQSDGSVVASQVGKKD